MRQIPPGRLRETSAVAFSGTDGIMGNQVSWALGYSVGRIGTEAQEPSASGMGASVEATLTRTPRPGSRSP